MEEYYRKRAPDYEKIYYNCEPEIKLANIYTAKLLQDYLSHRSVLEIACGTGYWTQFLSTTSKDITATDINKEVLDLAKQKTYKCPVSFQIMDAYKLAFEDNRFSAGLANFWFSHIPKDRIDLFLTGFHRTLRSNSRVFLANNNPQFLPDGRLVSFPKDENTYRLRTVSDGSEHYVLKNYYSVNELITIFSKHVENFNESNIYFDDYFWRVAYELK